ncbi:MAG: efflux RND transporter permease subunit [Cyanobacteria bacterium P01_G01_bin.54]
MNFSAGSIRRPVPTLMGFIVLILSGLLALTQLEIDESPNIDVPVAQVTVSQVGASPTELETQVTKIVEDAVASLNNVDEINSFVRDGRSQTIIQFLLETDTDRAVNDVRNAIAQIQQELPAEADPPVIERLTFAGDIILSYAVVSERRSLAELSELVDEVIAPELLKVEGVAQVDRVGGVDREIRVNLNPDRLLAYGITATQVNDQIRAWNTNLPAGQSTVAGSDRNIRTLGSADSVERLRRYPIVLPSGTSIALESLGSVEDGLAEVQREALLNQATDTGDTETVAPAPVAPETLSTETFSTETVSHNQPIVAFSALRSTGSSLVSVETGVQAAVQELTPLLPSDVQLQLLFTRAVDIRASYQSTISALVLGSLLTVVVVACFLRDWRATLITATALPLSILPTFWVIEQLGYTLNSMTLLGLALAMGNLVDDAICMIENIDQHLSRGKPPFQAALDASQEIGLAVIATTATIVGVFLPVAFMDGIPGQFFQPFGITVVVATLFSTLVAVTLTPMLSAYLLQPKVQPRMGEPGIAAPRPEWASPPSQRKLQPYRRLLTWSLHHRLLTLAIAVLLFFGSLQLVPLIPTGLFGGQDYGITKLIVQLPPGSPLAQTRQIVTATADRLRQNPNVKTLFADLRGSEADLFTILIPREQRQLSLEEFQTAIRPQLQQVPGATISFESQGAGGEDSDLVIRLTSNDPQALTDVANTLEAQMREIPGLVEFTASTNLVKPEIRVEPDPVRAGDLGVSVQSIARTLSLAAIGDIEANLAKFDLPDRQIPIRVQIDPDRRDDLNTLKNLQIPNQNGRLVPLTAVATVRLGSGPAEIDRFNRSRQITIGANLDGISLGDAYQAVQALPVLQNLPPGVEEQPAGDTKIMQDIFSSFAQALAASILCIYGVLVLLYNSFMLPVTILAALPLSVGGALLALLITQKELGLFALIGIILLMGLVTKNAILLVDCTLANQRQGQPQFHALVTAGVTRLRPILMTTFSTIAGMLPIAFELGADGGVRSPMAIAVIGGFTTSTLLTLVVVPVFFTYIEGYQTRIAQRFSSHQPTRFKPDS